MSGTSLISLAAVRLTINQITYDSWNTLISTYGDKLNAMKAEIFVDRVTSSGIVRIKIYILASNNDEELIDSMLSSIRKLGVDFNYSPHATYPVPLGSISKNMYFSR